MRTALITGITGQDGSFLAEFLLDKGYEVHGTIRRSSVDYRERIAHLEGQPNFHLHYADLGDSMSLLLIQQRYSALGSALNIRRVPFLKAGIPRIRLFTHGVHVLSNTVALISHLKFRLILN